MARMADGSLVSLDDRTAVYAYSSEGRDWEGEVVIPVDDPEAAWLRSGEDSFAPWAVAAKAIRAYRSTGEWPERVAFRS